eukprot:12651272-Ditylum_brightwellii.AAC.1
MAMAVLKWPHISREHKRAGEGKQRERSSSGRGFGKKCMHENIDDNSKETMKHSKWITWLHCWAANTFTHGLESPWGEHEIDYVLFFT